VTIEKQLFLARSKTRLKSLFLYIGCPQIEVFYAAGNNREERERDRGRQTDRETELTIEIPGKLIFLN
jgi:hypothetical protein